MGDNEYCAGGSVVLKEPAKGYLIVKIYADDRKLFEKRISATDLTVLWELNPPMSVSSRSYEDALTQT